MAEEAEDAGEETEDGAEGGEEEKKGGLKKLILFIGLAAVIVILGGVAGALMFLGGGEEEVVADAEAEIVEDAPTDAEQAAAYFEMYESPEFQVVTNIDDGGPNAPLISLNLVLVYEDPELTELFAREDVHLHLEDTYRDFIRTLRVEDINGSMGTFRLRAELLRRTNLVIAPARAERVLLTETLITQ
jgi:flagellar FliL protein